MASDRQSWRGAVGGRSDPPNPIVIEVPLAQSVHGGSGSFPALASDGRTWWVKPSNQRQGGRVMETEYLVGRFGSMIQAPVCEVTVAAIPSDLQGWEFLPGVPLASGLAHASLQIDRAQEAYDLLYRDADDNRRRHAGVFALYDWCWGGDDQWLYSESADRMLFSHDHGYYLPETGQTWSEQTLATRAGEPHVAPYAADGLDAPTLDALASRLEHLGRHEIESVLRSTPSSWPVPDSDLEALGHFLEVRAPAVATRLRTMAAML